MRLMWVLSLLSHPHPPPIWVGFKRDCAWRVNPSHKPSVHKGSQRNVYIRDSGALPFIRWCNHRPILHLSHIADSANSQHCPLCLVLFLIVLPINLMIRYEEFIHLLTTCLFFSPPLFLPQTDHHMAHGGNVCPRSEALAAAAAELCCCRWTLTFDPHSAFLMRLNVDPVQAGHFTCGHLCKHGNQDPLCPSGTANCCSVCDNGHTLVLCMFV